MRWQKEREVRVARRLHTWLQPDSNSLGDPLESLQNAVHIIPPFTDKRGFLGLSAAVDGNSFKQKDTGSDSMKRRH